LNIEDIVGDILAEGVCSNILHISSNNLTEMLSSALGDKQSFAINSLRESH